MNLKSKRAKWAGKWFTKDVLEVGWKHWALLCPICLSRGLFDIVELNMAGNFGFWDWSCLLNKIVLGSVVGDEIVSRFFGSYKSQGIFDGAVEISYS